MSRSKKFIATPAPLLGACKVGGATSLKSRLCTATSATCHKSWVMQELSLPAPPPHVFTNPVVRMAAHAVSMPWFEVQAQKSSKLDTARGAVSLDARLLQACPRPLQKVSDQKRFGAHRLLHGVRAHLDPIDQPSWRGSGLNVAHSTFPTMVLRVFRGSFELRKSDNGAQYARVQNTPRGRFMHVSMHFSL